MCAAALIPGEQVFSETGEAGKGPGYTENQSHRFAGGNKAVKIKKYHDSTKDYTNQMSIHNHHSFSPL